MSHLKDNRRHNVITASNAWSAVYERQKLWRQMTLREPPFEGNEMTEYGNIHESIALSALEKEFDDIVEPGNKFVLHDKLPFGASPDGYYDGNVIEIKCPYTQEVYKEIRKELIVEVDKETIAVANAAVLVGKCIQIANGFLYDENKNTLVLHQAKGDALESIISETNSPILLFYTFKADLQTIKQRFSQVQTLQENSEQKVKDWNDGKIPLLACHPASAGHGLNLQQGGNVIVWYGLTHSLELFEQANARIHRQGQTKAVIIHYILAENTIDSAVLAALRNKEKVQDAVFNSLK